MLILRRSQMDALERQAQMAFVRRYAGLIRRRVGDAGAGVSDEALEGEMQRLLVRARELGFTTDAAILSFIVLGIREAPYFYAHQPFRLLLADASVSDDRRIANLLRQASDADWKTAAARFAD